MFIPFNQVVYNNAIIEQEKRAPFMYTKFVNNTARKAGQIRGLVIEHHVAEYFRLNFANNYLEADNFQLWGEPCAHDFKLIINSKEFNVDVTGPKKDGSFGSYSLKPTIGVDFHIVAKPISFESWDKIDFKKGFEILGAVSSKKYTKQLDISNIKPIENLLNSLKS